MALETEFWDALSRLATTTGSTLARLVAQVDTSRTPGQPLASALRVHALTTTRMDGGVVP